LKQGCVWCALECAICAMCHPCAMCHVPCATCVCSASRASASAASVAAARKFKMFDVCSHPFHLPPAGPAPAAGCTASFSVVVRRRASAARKKQRAQPHNTISAAPRISQCCNVHPLHIPPRDPREPRASCQLAGPQPQAEAASRRVACGVYYTPCTACACGACRAAPRGGRRARPPQRPPAPAAALPPDTAHCSALRLRGSARGPACGLRPAACGLRPGPCRRAPAPAACCWARTCSSLSSSIL
jgi:hypothetical protein